LGALFSAGPCSGLIVADPIVTKRKIDLAIRRFPKNQINSEKWRTGVGNIRLSGAFTPRNGTGDLAYDPGGRIIQFVGRINF
jgi:hypothetical protein